MIRTSTMSKRFSAEEPTEFPKVQITNQVGTAFKQQ